MLGTELACQAGVFEVGNFAKAKSAYALLRRDSLRFSCLKAKAGGEGNRTPVLVAIHANIYMFIR